MRAALEWDKVIFLVGAAVSSFELAEARTDECAGSGAVIVPFKRLFWGGVSEVDVVRLADSPRKGSDDGLGRKERCDWGWKDARPDSLVILEESVGLRELAEQCLVGRPQSYLLELEMSCGLGPKGGL